MRFSLTVGRCISPNSTGSACAHSCDVRQRSLEALCPGVRIAGSSVSPVEALDSDQIHRENHTVVGVDLGVSTLATLSSGEKIVGPKALAIVQKLLRKLSRRFSRQMEAAQLRAGLAPGQPIPKGMAASMRRLIKSKWRRVRWAAVHPCLPPGRSAR